jgi:hypothetical protein
MRTQSLGEAAKCHVITHSKWPTIGAGVRTLQEQAVEEYSYYEGEAKRKTQNNKKADKEKINRHTEYIDAFMQRRLLLGITYDGIHYRDPN